MENTIADFYNIYYDPIKNTEQYLLDYLNNRLKWLNTQSENKFVEHIASRIKSPESTINKLIRMKIEPTMENAINYLSDIIGVRLITHFIGDIYAIRNILVNCGDLDVVEEKDYVMNPKPGGYRGYHIIINTEVDGFKIKAEIQLRTIAMDCWASLEHQIRYKKGIKNTDLINFELKKCSDDLMSADIAMEQIWDIVRSSTDDVSQSEDFFNEAMEYTELIKSKQDADSL